MKIKVIIGKAVRVCLCVAAALILFLVGILLLIYSPWAQEILRRGVVNKMSGGQTELTLDYFRLSFPLDIDAGGIAMLNNGDTLAAASSLHASIKLLPLLKGKAVVESLSANDARYTMGAPDSLMYMTIAADSLGVNPASVLLSDMAISLEEATIRGGRLGIFLRSDTSTAQKPTAEPTKMSIELGRIALDDFDYTMRLMPSIDTLGAHIARAELIGGRIDMLTQKVSLGRFSGHGLDARYIAPDSTAIALGGPYPAMDESGSNENPDSAAMPWTVAIDSIAFTDSHALYTTRGLVPQPGLDFGYIEVSDLDLSVSDFYNRETTVRLPIALSGKERCGVNLDIVGQLDISDTALSFNGVSLHTANGTDVAFKGVLGMGDMAADPSLPLSLTLRGGFDPADLGMMFPVFDTYLAAIPAADDVLLEADVDGTTGRFDVSSLDLRLNNCVHLGASGWVGNVMQPDLLSADISLKGSIINVNSFKNRLLAPATAKTLNVPPMTLNGHVGIVRGTIDGRLTAATGKGRIKMDARWNGKAEAYKATVATAEFPVQAFMPLLGVDEVTALIRIDGRGYDPMKKSTRLTAQADISKAVYNKVAYTDISAKATLEEGQASVALVSDNPDAELRLDAHGNLDGNIYTWSASLDGSNIDLFALKFTPAPASLELMMRADATVGPGINNIDAKVALSDLFYRTEKGIVALQDVDALIKTNDSTTDMTVTNRDLKAAFHAPVAPDSLVASFGATSGLLAEQLRTYFVDIDTLGHTLPPFTFEVSGGSSNMVNDFLAPSKMSVRALRLNASNDSTLTVDGYVRRLQMESARIDSIYLSARQHHEHLHLAAGMLNKPGNMDEWHDVSLKGVVDGNRLNARLHQENIKGKTGFDIGLRLSAEAADSTFTLNISPTTPTIGYQSWLANDDNFISYRLPDSHIDANLHMHGANSSLAIFTQHPDSLSAEHEQEDLNIQLTDIHIQDWIAFNPFAPPVKGDISADMRLNRAGDQLVGKGSASISDFFYGRDKVADFNADFDVAATPSGAIRANTELYVNGQKTMILSGTLNDSTALSPLAMDFSMIRFPLETANPFIPKSIGRLKGVLNGTMEVSGTSDRPILNGWLDFDSTAVHLAITGTDYTFSEEKIPVKNNLVTFKGFAINGCNANPLLIDGTVDASDFSDMRLDLGMKADNMQLVNSNKAAKGADVFGKAFIDLEANARGSMKLLRVNADLRILPATNVTYVIPEASSMIASQANSDMVRFVNFTDSLAVANADSLSNDGMAMFLDASLNVDEGSIINVYLSADGKNRAQIQSYGTLDYSMSPLDTDGNLIGRLNIDKGFVRYTPPLMSEKLFSFKEGGYVAFNGNMLNPQIRLQAVDVLKANVTQDGQNSRLVNFDVSLSVTGSLEKLDVAFDLSTNDDITVANELETMTAEQRANQAMNLLLYNVYTGPGTKANASLSGNPLFSFLESQINTWAANNIKGVDLSFGIDQYDRTVNGSSSSTMSYSYQVSKSLFNDRFKIVVGGNYSTDANADENFSQNLINDISFEYFLNAARSMYLRLFRHTGYESILEGEITQTGVGFVYRRKLQRISDMFLPPGKVKARQEKEAKKLTEEYLRTHPEKAQNK